jgi:hypothetical protein
MGYMVSDLLERVRQVLQDQDQNNYRYPTSDLIDYLNDAVSEAKRLRPDLFIGTYVKSRTFVSNNPATDYTTVPFPLPESCFMPTVGYVCGFVEVRDDEFSDTGRAMTFMNSFTQKLLGVA